MIFEVIPLAAMDPVRLGMTCEEPSAAMALLGAHPQPILHWPHSSPDPTYIQAKHRNPSAATMPSPWESSTSP